MMNHSEQQPYSNSEREFLHDLCNPLAISYGNLRILSSKLEADSNSLDIQTILTKINKAIESFERANDLLERRRIHLRNTEEP